MSTTANSMLPLRRRQLYHDLVMLHYNTGNADRCRMLSPDIRRNNRGQPGEVRLVRRAQTIPMILATASKCSRGRQEALTKTRNRQDGLAQFLRQAPTPKSAANTERLRPLRGHADAACRYWLTWDQTAQTCRLGRYQSCDSRKARWERRISAAS
jgi:hypothetical protein